MNIKNLLKLGGLTALLSTGSLNCGDLIKKSDSNQPTDALVDEIPYLERTGIVNIVDPNNFDQEVLESEFPVVVNFYAEWCKYCSEMKPVFEQYSQQYTGMKFAKFNIDKDGQSRSIFEKYGDNSIPLFQFFNQGRLYEQYQVSGSYKIKLKMHIEAFLKNFGHQ